MIVFKKIISYFKEVLKRPFRTPKAIIEYSHADISAGVIIGPNCILGQNTKIYENSILANTIIGDYSYIGGNSELKNCTIGKYCSIAPEVRIGLGIHPTDKISTYPGFYSRKASGAVQIGEDPNTREYEPVVIGHDVWVGNRAMIMDGVEVGNGCIVAAGSVVTKNIEPYSIVGGVPAKLIRKRFEANEIDALQELKWWDKGLQFCIDNADLFNNPQQFFRKYKSGAG
ncbi:MAG: antibiotic acetyltransferase [Gammaproteobacteria bacterium]|nr:MAG: antibiotic acetyltransferase [Gammaproteobacteria bacterium]